MDTFDDLQRPFALFKAPIAHAVIDRAGECVRCGEHDGMRFQNACYKCFRVGELETVMDTEFGMVTWEDAVAGRTHGVPLNDPSSLDGYTLSQHPVDPRFPEDRWYHVHIDSRDLIELLRTPKYQTWQGESWLFCCQRPMVFRGSLPADHFTDNLDLLLAEIENFIAAPDWRQTVGDGHGSHAYYVFSCSVCHKLRYNDDCD